MVEDGHGRIDALRRIEAFHDLPPDALAEIADRMEACHHDSGASLVAQGGPGNGLFVLLSGHAKGWLLDESGARRELAEFQPGEVIGEMSLVTGEPRTASVEATEATESLWLGKEAFQDVAFRYPELGMVLTAIMAARLGERDLDGLGGKVVGKYRIQRSLGRGGMSVVYEALAESGDTVALKMMSYRLLYERGAMARFRREAEIIARLDHENIVHIHEMFPAYRTQFLVMEYCDALDLGHRVAAEGPWAGERVRGLAGQLASALAHMHAKGIVHRDLKPSNVLLTRNGMAKLTDFGLASAPYAAEETPLTEARRLLGTPLYMAPEQWGGETATEASDVYALGCVLYEALTGKPPGGGATLGEVFESKRSFALPPADAIGRGVPADLYAFLESALAWDPAARTYPLDVVRGWADRV